LIWLRLGTSGRLFYTCNGLFGSINFEKFLGSYETGCFSRRAQRMELVYMMKSHKECPFEDFCPPYLYCIFLILSSMIILQEEDILYALQYRFSFSCSDYDISRQSLEWIVEH
jgi:hypothetical protein